MTQRIVNAFKFTDEAAALVALAEFTAEGDTGPVFRMDICDPIGAIYRGNGVFTTDPETGIESEGQEAISGWHVNVCTDTARDDLPGFVGAWRYGERNEAGEVILVAGDKPRTPARDFAA